MKRSHVENTIQSYLRDFDIGGRLSKLTYEESSKLLLNELLKLGMLPPKTTVTHKVSETLTQTYEVPQWEQE